MKLYLIRARFVVVSMAPDEKESKHEHNPPVLVLAFPMRKTHNYDSATYMVAGYY
jgi:hypothetical protein